MTTPLLLAPVIGAGLLLVASAASHVRQHDAFLLALQSHGRLSASLSRRAAALVPLTNLLLGAALLASPWLSLMPRRAIALLAAALYLAYGLYLLPLSRGAASTAGCGCFPTKVHRENLAVSTWRAFVLAPLLVLYAVIPEAAAPTGAELAVSLAAAFVLALLAFELPRALYDPWADTSIEPALA